MHVSASWRRCDVASKSYAVAVLMVARADPTARDSKGETPADKAKKTKSSKATDATLEDEEGWPNPSARSAHPSVTVSMALQTDSLAMQAAANIASTDDCRASGADNCSGSS